MAPPPTKKRVRSGRAIVWGTAAAAAGSLIASTAVGIGAGAAPSSGGPILRPEAQLLALINDYRRSRHAPPLIGQPRLQAAASWYANDMARNDSFSHTHVDSLGRPPEDRFHQFGYQWAAAEVSAAGPTSPVAALQYWKASPGHNAILIDPVFHQAGVGIGFNPAAPDHYFWAASLGTGSGSRTSMTILVERPRHRRHSVKAAATAHSGEQRLPELALSRERAQLRVGHSAPRGRAAAADRTQMSGRAR